MKKILIISSILLFLTGCTSLKENFTSEGRFYNQAKIYYQDGRYISSLESCLDALMYDPLYYEAKALLKRVYNLAIDEVEDTENRILNNGKRFNNEELYYLFLDMDLIFNRAYKVSDSLKPNNFKEKIVIYREKAALDYYNAGVDESYNITLSKENRCFEYFKKANEIWGEEYLDSNSIAASVLYNKAKLYTDLGNREALIKAINTLKEINSWVNGYKDSKELIDKLIEKATSYFLVIGDDLLSSKIELLLLSELQKHTNNLIKLSSKKNIASYTLLENDDLYSISKEFNIDTVVEVSLEGIEYTPPQLSANFKLFSKRYWVDNMDNPLELSTPELVEYWENEEDYRYELYERGITGFKDFVYSYIEYTEYSKLRAKVNIKVYSISLGQQIGNIEVEEDILDEVNWTSSQRGVAELFPESVIEDNKIRSTYSYNELLSSLKKQIDLSSLIETTTDLIIEDNPLNKKID